MSVSWSLSADFVLVNSAHFLYADRISIVDWWMGGCHQTFSKWPLLQFLSDSYKSWTHDLCANTKKTGTDFHYFALNNFWRIFKIIHQRQSSLGQ